MCAGALSCLGDLGCYSEYLALLGCLLEEPVCCEALAAAMGPLLPPPSGEASGPQGAAAEAPAVDARWGESGPQSSLQNNLKNEQVTASLSIIIYLLP